MRLDHVDGLPSVACALLPWLIPPVTTALAVIAVIELHWDETPGVLVPIGAFVLGLLLALGLALAIESHVLGARLGALESRRLPVCPQCSYDQRGTSGDRCPECDCPVCLETASPGRAGEASMPRS